VVLEQRKRGRPRSDAARRAIFGAAIAELQERGYAALTVEGIAARAGTGKQTIYRWWASKADVVLDAMLDLAAAQVKIPDSGELKADLDLFITDTFRQHWQRPMLVGLMAQAQLDPVFAANFREKFLFGRRAALRTVFAAARERGEVGADVDLELLIDIVYGVLWYRLLVDHLPLDKESARHLTALVVHAVHSSRAGKP
jgi:AcrR family transcriptional regulator